MNRNLQLVKPFLIVGFIFIVILSNVRMCHCYMLPTATTTPTTASSLLRLQQEPTLFSTSTGPLGKDDGDLQATLNLYQNWASVCNDDGYGDRKNAMISLDSNPKLQHLWQTVTQTINCGHGTIKTVTKTRTAYSTATFISKGTIPVCTGKCWSDYLWHTYGYGISVAQAFTGIVCMMIGVYFMVFGFHFFRPTLALTGFVFFATMTWVGLANNEPFFGYPHTDIIYTCVCAGLGIIGAGMGMFFFSISIYLIGGLGGFYLAVWILAWKACLVITVKVAQICFIVGLGISGAALVYLLETYILIASTGFVGAYLFLFGLDFFAHTGLLNAWLLIFDCNPYHYNSYIIERPVVAMLSFVAFFFLLSVIWQYLWNVKRNKRSFGVNVVESKASEKH